MTGFWYVKAGPACCAIGWQWRGFKRETGRSIAVLVVSGGVFGYLRSAPLKGLINRDMP